MAPEIVKFSDSECGTCFRMSRYDTGVAARLGMKMVSVDIDDVDTYATYRHILLKQYPELDVPGFPVYIVVDSMTALDPVIKGVVIGGMDKGALMRALMALAD